MVEPLQIPLKQLLLALGLATTGYAVALLFTGTASATPWWQSLASPAGLMATVLCLLSFVLRGLRWRRWMAHHQRHLGLLQGLRLYVAGYTFTPTPGNVGEAARGLLLARQPLTAAESLAVFGAERLADLLGILLLTLPGIAWLLQHNAAHQVLLALAALATVGLLLGLLLAYKYQAVLLRRWPWLAGAWQCLSEQPALWLSWTLLAWSAQGLALYLLCAEMGLTLALGPAIGLYALAMLGGAVSMLPAGLGSMEALLTALLVSAGASGAVALNLTVLIRLLSLWLAVALGAVALLYSAAVRKDLRLH